MTEALTKYETAVVRSATKAYLERLEVIVARFDAASNPDAVAFCTSLRNDAASAYDKMMYATSLQPD